MYSCISVKNSATLPIWVYADDVLLLSDFLQNRQSLCLTLPAGSSRITVFNVQGKLLFDIWVSIAPDSRHLLEIFDTEFVFKSFPRS